jgi:hypothetical protein
MENMQEILTLIAFLVTILALWIFRPTAHTKKALSPTEDENTGCDAYPLIASEDIEVNYKIMFITVLWFITGLVLFFGLEFLIFWLFHEYSQVNIYPKGLG